jgi:signal transduction histidine kinase
MLSKADSLKKQIKSLQQISVSLSQTLDFDELYPIVMREVSLLLGAERSTLFLLDEKNNEVWSKIAEGHEFEEIRFSVGKGIAGWVIQNGKTLNIDNVYNDSRFNSEIDRKSGFKTKSALTVPLFEPNSKKNAKIIGAIQVLNSQEKEFFDDKDLVLLEILATQIAASFNMAKLYSDLRDKNNELSFFYNFEKHISSIDEFDKLLHELVEETVTYQNAEAGSILLKVDENHLAFRVATGNFGNHLKSLRIERGKGIVGWVFENEKPLLIEDVTKDKRFYSKISTNLGMKIQSIVAVPIFKNDKIFGVLEILNSQAKTFQKKDQKFLEIVASRLGRMIDRFELRSQKQLQNRMSSVGKMVATVVHDLRSPLNTANGFLELLNENPKEKEQKEYISIINSELNTLMGMTKDILDFSKGKREILPRKIGTSDVGKKIVKVTKIILKKNNVIFDYTNTASNILLYADLEKLTRVFVNLIKNSVESFTKKTKKYIQFNIFEENNAVCFSLSDNGPGIPDEIRDNVFDSFITSGKEEGTGLGLAIVKQIIDEHEGKIILDSSKKGTTFKIYLNKYFP